MREYIVSLPVPGNPLHTTRERVVPTEDIRQKLIVIEKDIRSFRKHAYKRFDRLSHPRFAKARAYWRGVYVAHDILIERIKGILE